MSEKAEGAATLAGWSQNPNVPVEQRLLAAEKALNFYIDQADKLDEMVEYCERQRTGNPNADQAITWGHAGDLIQKIRDGEPVDEFDRLRKIVDGEPL